MSPGPEGRGALRRLGEPTLAFLLQLLLLDAAIETVISGSPVRWWVAGAVGLYLGGDALLWWRRPEWSRSVRWSTRAMVSFFVLLGLLAFTVWLPGGLREGMVLLGQDTSVLLCGVAAAAVALTGASLLRIDALGAPGRAAVAAVAIYAVVAFVWAIPAEVPYPELFQGESAWSRLPFWLQGAFLGGIVLLPVALILTLVERFIPIFGDERRRYAAPLPWLQWAERLIRPRARHPHSLAFRSVALTMSLAMAVAGLVEPLMPGGDSRAFDRDPDASTAFDRDAPAGFDRNAPAGFDRDGEESGATAEESPWATLSSDSSAEEIADRLGKLFDAVEMAAAEIPRTTFDAAAVVEQVGPDPVALFEWVRDSTYLVPYRGLLRGHTGVLMDRLGNSLDRAMLLYSLVITAGHEARLARGTLPDGEAERFFRLAPAPPMEEPSGSSSPPPIAPDTLARYARDFGIDPAELREAAERAARMRERMRHEAVTRTDQQAEALAAAVEPFRTSNAPRAGTPGHDALRDHWWVQWRGPADWVDFDPTLPDARPGQRLTAPQDTARPQQLTDLDSEDLHSLSLRVVIEIWDDGQVTEVPVLEQDLLPAGLIGERMAVRLAPLSWPEDLDLVTQEDPQARFREAVLAQNAWLPVLEVGDRTVYKHAFNDYGDLTDVTLPGWAQAVMAGRQLVRGAEEGIRGMGGRIGAMLSGGGRQEEPPRRPHVAAAWIDYEIRAPGEESRTVRRQIFDLIGPAARARSPVPAPEMNDRDRLRRGLALTGETEILPLVSAMPVEFVDYRVLSHVVDNRRPVLGLVRDMSSPGSSPPLEGDELVSRLPVHLYNLAVARSAWSTVRDEVFLDQLNILTLHRGVGERLEEDLGFFEAFDIVANEVAVRAGSTGNPYLIRLQQGVFDTNAEAVLLPGCLDAESLLECRRGENAAELFAASVEQGIDWVGLDPRDPEWSAVELPPDVVSRLEQEAAAGQVVIVPRETIGQDGRRLAAWWRIDPSTGQCLGFGGDGWGQTATSYKLTKAEKAYLIGTGLLWAWVAKCSLDAERSGDPSGLGICVVKGMCFQLGMTAGLFGDPIGGALIIGMCRFIPT